MRVVKYLFLPILGVLAVFSCSQSKEKKSASSEVEHYYSYTFNNGSDSLEVEVKNTPQKPALFSQFMTEMLLELDLGDQIVIGTSEGNIHPKFKEQYDKIPTKLLGHHSIFSKEEFLLTGVDFVSGWDDAIRAETTGTARELLANGIYPFSVKSIRDGETLETLYKDFETLGKIFKVEDRAKKIITDLKNKLANAEKDFVKVSDAEKKKIMICSSIDSGIYVAGGFSTDLIKRAGGKNIYEEIRADHEMVSFESLVHRNPDYILIAHLEGEEPFEEKVKILKNHPALKNLPAIKNNQIIPITLEDISPGIRNIDFIIMLNKLMYER